MKLRKKYDIIIIDSGLNRGHLSVNVTNCDGIHLFYENNVIKEDLDISDMVGHGTAVYHIIREKNPDAKILVVKIFNDDDVDADLLIDTLMYIHDNYECKVINMSQGVTYCSRLNDMQNICEKLYQRGTIIVAAFANSGAMSYPAALKHVIGVDNSLSCKHIYEYEYVEDSPINLRASAVTQKLPWLGNENKRVSGTSFACPHIASNILKLLNNGQCEYHEIECYLNSNAKKRYPSEHRGSYKRDREFCIEKAITFPFNKEIHSIIRYSDLLIFDVIDVYDSKYLGNCGKSTSQLLHIDLQKDYVVKNIDTIEWRDDFDTIILGHLRELKELLGKDILKDIINKCIQYGKNIYSFDDISEYIKETNNIKIKVYTPKIEKCCIPDNRFGKLYKISTPILCIVGTSSKQGKYTTQLFLRKRFLETGYNVGQLGTEPTSELFGMDEVYPMGYGSTSTLIGLEEVIVINQLLHNIELKNKDIIIMGSQSQTIACDLENLKYIPLRQNNLLYSADADGYLLICNYFDDTDYIGRTIKFLNHFRDNNVIAIGVFPADAEWQWSYLSSKRKPIEYSLAKKRASELQEYFGIPAFVLGKEDEKIFQKCLDYFTIDI